MTRVFLSLVLLFAGALSAAAQTHTTANGLFYNAAGANKALPSQVTVDTNTWDVATPGALRAGSGSSTAGGYLELNVTNQTYVFRLSPNASQAADMMIVGPASAFSGIVKLDNSSGTMTLAPVTIGANLAWDGTTLSGTGGSGTGVLFRDGNFIGTNNSTAEFTLYTNATAISANTLSTNVTATVVATGTLTNSTGGGVTHTFKFYFNGSVVHTFSQSITSSSSGARPWRLTCRVSEYGTTAQQFQWATLEIGPAGSLGSGGSVFVTLQDYNRTTADATAAISLGLTITMGTANAAADCYKYSVVGSCQ